MVSRAVAAHGPVPQAEERDGFKFRSGRLALDLAASLAFRLRPRPEDLLKTPRDLGRWLVAAGLATADPEPSPADLKAARALREALYRLALCCVLQQAFPDRDRALVNSWAALPPPAPQIGRDGLIWARSDVRTMLAAVARDGVLLLGGPQAERLRKCARSGCALLFVDTSRAGRRRWCSMAACGNRVKVREFRRRHRG
jgi:predicted RNA-binding Zn ribbon-like protein